MNFEKQIVENERFSESRERVSNSTRKMIATYIPSQFPSCLPSAEYIFLPYPQTRHMNKKYPSKLPTPAPHEIHEKPSAILDRTNISVCIAISRVSNRKNLFQDNIFSDLTDPTENTSKQHLIFSLHSRIDK